MYFYKISGVFLYWTSSLTWPLVQMLVTVYFSLKKLIYRWWLDFGSVPFWNIPDPVHYSLELRKYTYLQSQWIKCPNGTIIYSFNSFVWQKSSSDVRVTEAQVYGAVTQLWHSEPSSGSVSLWSHVKTVSSLSQWVPERSWKRRTEVKAWTTWTLE